MSSIDARLEALAIFDLPDDYYVHYPAVLHEVTREDVRQAARRYLDPDRMAVVAVGPAEELSGQLEDLGPLAVHTP